MSRMARTFSVGALIAIAVCLPAASAEAQIPANVRVVTGSARILRWLRPPNDVILNVDQGTTLEVLDQDEDWYWVVLPRDLHGTRRVGWIRVSAVEPVVPTAAVPSQGQKDEASVVPAAPAAAEDKVTISVRNAADPGSAEVPGTTKSYTFEDLHFERDRYSIRREDIDSLRVAVAALKADPSLVVTIEGYTCSLGTATYNLALGARRADAVRDYLVSEGVPADRLLTVSRGEQQATHDNSREATRRLNRRVTLVPNVQR